MGKIRRSKQTRPKRNRAVDNSDEEEELPVDSKENVIQTILDQLQAADVEEKYCGLQTFAMMIENPENIPQLISCGLVKVAAPLLLDQASSVRNAAAGTLRNLSTVSMDICDAMMDQDIMTPVTCYFHEHAVSWVPNTNSRTKDEDIDTFIQIINLLLNLCESSDLAVKYFGQSRILDILLRYLDLGTFSSDVVTAVLQCLFVVVEDNPAAMAKIISNAENQLQVLLKLEGEDSSLVLLKTLSAGVIINTCGGNITRLPNEVIKRIMYILANTLSVDHRLICSQLSSTVPLKDESGKVEAPKGKAAQQLESQIQAVSQMLTAQQTSIEIIANICSCEDADDLQGSDASESDDADEEFFENGDETTLAEDKLGPEVMEAFISLEIFDKVWARTQIPASNVMLILKEYEGSQLIYKRLLSLQTRALLCINNLISILPIENLGEINGVYKIWVDTGKLFFKHAENVNLSESATAVMRAALDKIKCRHNANSNDCNLFSDLALSDIEIMLTGVRECQVPEIRSNLIRMVGILASLLVNNLNDITSNVICTITEFILEQAHKESEVWVLAEAVDTLVDLFSEDETDELAAKVKLTDKLAILAPILRNKARQQKRLPKEYKVLVSTAASNLPRFIKYKKDRVSKL